MWRMDYVFQVYNGTYVLLSLYGSFVHQVPSTLHSLPQILELLFGTTIPLSLLVQEVYILVTL